MIACDFFTVDTASLRQIYVLFFIELQTRRVHVAGCTTSPNGVWVVQQARNLAHDLGERSVPLRFLIHDRDSKFSAGFDKVFQTEGVTVIKTPVRVYVEHYNSQRPHRALALECPDRPVEVAPLRDTQPGQIRRKDRLGGVLHEYARAA